MPYSFDDRVASVDHSRAMVITGSDNKQEMDRHSLEDVLQGYPKSEQQQEKKPRPHPETALKCPRCDSTNTKFCYYNNYSLSQPRYFCKGCRRYWTKGGSIRNVPVGGGCRKNKKSSSKRTQDHFFVTTNPNTLLPTLPPPPPPSLPYNPTDLSLAFARLHSDSFLIGNPNPNRSSSYVSNNNASTGFLDILRSGYLDNATINPNGFHNVYNGFGEGVEGCSLGFDGGGLLGSSMTTPATVTTTTPCTSQDGDQESKLVMGLQWQLGGDHVSTSLDRTGLECWNNGVGSSYWHGVINSFLI